LKLHQALFGYDSGHHLLGTSFQLSTDSRHALALATDLSGSAPAEGFDISYTGMPLPGTNLYTLFCTWLAPEMPRPGCVWSHALFIELADLATLVDLASLKSLFLRPAQKQLFRAYEAPLSFTSTVTSITSASLPTAPASKELLLGLYSLPEHPVVAIADENAELERVTFAIWSQQWPRLRREFRFSTGSFADRGRMGAPFDLQISPTANRRAWQRNDKFTLIGRQENNLSASSSTTWLRCAEADLAMPDVEGFRAFLRSYGADVSSPRSAFSRLAETFERTRSVTSDWRETLESIGSAFPDPSDALTLKRKMVEAAEDSNPVPLAGRVAAIISFFLTSPLAPAFAELKLDFPKFATSMWMNDKDETQAFLQELVRLPESPSAVAFASAIASAVKPAELESIADSNPELVPFIFGYRPDLACRVETWLLPAHTQSRIYEVLLESQLDGQEWGKIVGAMFIAATNVGIKGAVEKAGSYALDGAFLWLDAQPSHNSLPSQGWREALSLPAMQRLRDGLLSIPSQLALAAWFLAAESVRDLLSSARSDIQLLASRRFDEIPSPLRLHTAFLLVSLGLRSKDENGLNCMLRGFFQVYDALATSSYAFESWLLLAPELPYLGLWRE
jgi:hypothetical protein